MSNTKAVRIKADVPYNWTEKLTEKELRCWANWVWSPSTGLQITYEDASILEYTLVVQGIEAIPYAALDCLIDSLKRCERTRFSTRPPSQPQNLVHYEIRDLDNQ